MLITSAAGAFAELSFTGTAVKYFTDRDAAFGSVDASMDGGAPQAVSLSVENSPRQCGVAVFRAEGLKKGAHKIQIVKRAAATITIDTFRVYPGG